MFDDIEGAKTKKDMSETDYFSVPIFSNPS